MDGFISLTNWLGDVVPENFPPPASRDLERGEAALREFAARRRSSRAVILTGAGISAESGIPTFRGPEGYWTVGSREYRPEELATQRQFRASPRTVWGWYLYRTQVCFRAEPNRAHRALSRWEESWESRFQLVTQNVDGLHARAGNSPERTYCIHGRVDRMRCSQSCPGLFPTPEVGCELTSEVAIDAALSEVLHCNTCGAWMRPHVLWFDEYYEEEHYRSESAMVAGLQADVLVTIGSSGATQLPMRLATSALERGVCIVDINPEPNPFSEIAARSEDGIVLTGSACFWVPRLVDQLLSESK